MERESDAGVEAVAREITVVMPVYNRAAIVGEAVRSIAAQRVRPAALLLVDNASIDGTAAVLASLASELSAPGFEVRVLSEGTPGAAAARNRGLTEVTTDWVMFFDSDDVMLPGHVESAARAVAGAPQADVVGWDVDMEIAPGRLRRVPFEVRDMQYHNLFHATFATQRYMARTSLVRRAGGWDPAMLIWDDIELGARLLSLAPHVVKVAGDGGATVVVARHESSISGLTFASRKEHYAAPLRAMAATLGERCHHWVALKAMILAADMAREQSEAGPALRRAILGAVPSWRTRAMLRFAYSYRRWGGRGVARLLHPFVN